MPAASTLLAPCAGSSALSGRWSFWITVCWNQELIASEDVIVSPETRRKSLDHDNTTRPYEDIQVVSESMKRTLSVDISRPLGTGEGHLHGRLDGTSDRNRYLRLFILQPDVVA